MHTEIPWRLSFSGLGITSKNGLICSVWNPGKVDETKLPGESWLDMRKRTEPEHARLEAEALANAALIVRACNSHDELVAALQEAENVMESAKAALSKAGNNGEAAFLASAAEQARAALAKAKGGQS